MFALPSRIVCAVENMTEYMKTKDNSRQQDNFIEYKLTANLLVDILLQMPMCKTVYTSFLPIT